MYILTCYKKGVFFMKTESFCKDTIEKLMPIAKMMIEDEWEVTFSQKIEVQIK